jgi:NADPH:quinone reductase-like Zn-dependent oxidoreductase
MVDEDPPRFKRILEEVMRLWHEGGITGLKPVQVYPFSKIQDAYRYMQSGAHSGKIVLEPHDEDEVPVSILLVAFQDFG